MIRNWMMRLSLLSLAFAYAACGGGGEKAPAASKADKKAPAATKEAPAADAGAYEVAAVSDGGTVSGKVSFGGEDPDLDPIEVTKDNQVCGEEKADESITVGADGGLADAVVWLTDITKGKDWANGAGAIDQKDCKYSPHVQGVREGSKLEIVNSDAVLHNIHAYSGGETLFNIAQPTQGQKTPKKLKVTGPVELKCDVHSWMHAWVFVAPHPYFAVTGEDGSFSIGDVPAGTYKVKAWHGSLGDKEMEVTVAAAGTGNADFSFTGE